MSKHWTLPLVQIELDSLRPGDQLTLGCEDATLLFGLNSAALGRMNNFAVSHDCEVVFTSGGVFFRKTTRTGTEPAT